jgi:hypothetical protein
MLVFINKSKELTMHTDEHKKFDIRTIGRNTKAGIITQKDYETYLSKLPDVSDKVFNPEEASQDFGDVESKREGELSSKKKELKKKVRSKGK